MFLGETFNISGAKIGRGCTISRYTLELFSLKDAKRVGECYFNRLGLQEESLELALEVGREQVLADSETLIVVIIERIERIGVIYHDIKQSLVLVIRFNMFGSEWYALTSVPIGEVHQSAHYVYAGSQHSFAQGSSYPN